MFKKLVYISLLLFCYHFGFSQGVGNNNGADITVSSGTHIVITGSGKLINNGASVITNNGTITIASDFQNNGTATINNNGTINVAGDWDNNAGNNVFTNRNKVGTTVLNGTATQTISGNTNFENLTINNSAAGSAISLSDDQTVENTVTLTDGVITTGANNLIVNSTVGSVVQGNSSASFVNGNLRKYVGYSNCLDFDGTNDYVNTGFTPTGAAYPNWTVECWVKGTNSPSAANYSGPVYGDNTFAIIWDHTNAAFRGTASIRVGGTYYAASFGALSANTWYYLAATYDGENLLAYKNGVLITTNSSLSGTPDNDGTTLKIGAHPNIGAGNFFNGKIDEVRIWNIARTQSEIQQTMYGLLAGTETGLMAYYQFEDGTGSGTLTDITASSFDGTLTNMDNANDWVSNTKHNTFVMPVGNGTATTNYYPMEIEPTALSAGAFTYLDTKFDALATGGTLSLTEETSIYTEIASEGEWYIVANNAPTSIKYNATVYTTNISSLTNNQFTILKRSESSSDAADWSCTPCGVSTAPADGINANDGAGRMVADGYALRRGFTSFSKLGAGKTGFPLPIKLTSFKGECNQDKVVLNWQSSSEINNNYYLLETSSDGKHFVEIQKTNGKGTTNTISNYTITSTANKHISYYRLSQVDFDGKTTILSTIMVSPCNAINNSINLIKTGNANYQITNITSPINSYNVIIYNSIGQKIPALINKNENSIDISFNNFSTGIYYISLTSQNEVTTYKILAE